MDNHDIFKKNQLSIQSDFLQKNDSSNKEHSSIYLKHLVSSIYQDLQRFYQEHRKTQTITLMLNRMTNTKNIPSEFYTRPLLKILEEICDTLMMEELEISLWAIYLENIIWGKTALYCENDIWFAAYAGKYLLNDNLEIYDKILLEKNSNFFQLYKIWNQRHQSDLTVDSICINGIYNKLAKIAKSNPITVLNYNYYVDNIPDFLKNEKKNSSGSDEDIIKKKRKLGKNKEKIIFDRNQFAEKSIKDVKNGTKKLKMLSRDKTRRSLKAQNAGTVKNEKQKQEKYLDGENDTSCTEQMESDELDVGAFLNKEWIF